MKKNYFVLAVIAVMMMFVACVTEGAESSDNEQSSAAPQQTQPQQPQPETVTYTFNANGGKWSDETTANKTFSGTVGDTFTKPTNPTRTGYSFSNWDKAVPSVFDGSDDTFTAQWTMNTYTIVFNANGGEGEMSSMDMTYDVSADLPANAFSKDGCLFVGWASSADGEMVYTNEQEVNDLTTDDGAAITLYAIWMENTYSIQYLNAKGTNSNVTSFKESDVITLNDLSADGYTFDGWFEVVNDATSDTSINGWTAGEKTADITLWAKWTPHTYTIKFDKNGGEGTMDNLPMTYDVSADLPANAFSKDGCLFVGWASSADGEVVYTDEQEVKDLTADNEAEVILYAIWKVKIGAIMYSDMTFSSEYVDGKTPLGIVFEVGTKVKIVHLSQQSTLKWCLDTADGYDRTLATSLVDGSGNWQIICDAVSDEGTAGNYPAFEYVIGLGSGWYLPAKDELNAVYTNMTAINTALKALCNAGVSVTSLGRGYYWSSSSSNNGDVWCQEFDSGSQSDTYKDNYRLSVRAIRAF